MPLTSLILLTVLLVLIGHGGCLLAERLRVPRLVRGVALVLILAHIVMPGYQPDDLFTSADPAEKALAEHQQQSIKDREVLESIGVTSVALRETQYKADQRAAELQAQIDRLRAQDRLHFNLALAYPTLMVAFGMALFIGPRRERFARNLPFMLAGSLSAAALAALVGWGFLAVGWLETGGVPTGWWLLGLAIGCAVTSIPGRETTERDRLWRYAFEPLLFALVGSQVDLIGSLDLPLVIVVLILFVGGKLLGAALLRRYISRRPWRESIRTGAAIGAGGPTALAVSYALHALGAIDAALFTALVIAIVVAALVSRAILAGGDSRPI